MFRTLISALFSVILLAGCASSDRDLTTQWRDKQLEMEVAGIVSKVPYTGNMNIDAIAYNGELLVAGTSRNLDLTAQFTEQLQTLNAKQIITQIRPGEQPSLGSVSSDSFITTQVRTAILTDSQISSGSIKVMTQQGVVYLMGTLPEAKIAVAVDKARHIEGVTSVVTIIRALQPAVVATPATNTPTETATADAQ
uniref:BON domain-containing protein n=1 Tax=Thaumasiovibrio occultus TaxID=1891184 RepID=UPI00131CEBB1|nr:BON domain-containing protein [Thaumasiovibrio occultus]